MNRSASSLLRVSCSCRLRLIPSSSWEVGGAALRKLILPRTCQQAQKSHLHKFLYASYSHTLHQAIRAARKMPRAVQGEHEPRQNLPHLLNYNEGVLVECDPSIKAIITRIDEQHGHAFIIEDIDDEHVLVKSHKHDELKRLLKDVKFNHLLREICPILTSMQKLKDAVKEAEDSSESE